jgi:hypothetical protein
MNIIKKIIYILIIVGIFILLLAYLSSRDKVGIETTLVSDIQYRDENVSLIERIKENEKETALVIKINNQKQEIDNFPQNNEIPVEILDVFTFKTKKDEYIITITNSYIKNGSVDIDDGGYYKDLYIYNSKGEYMTGFEKKIYEIDFDNKNIIIQKLQELESQGLI